MAQGDREKVLAKYPDAWLLGPLRDGLSDPDGGYGVVLHAAASAIFATGDTEDEAWASAAKRLKGK